MLYDIMIFEGEVLLLLLGLVNCDDWVFDDLDDYCIGCEIGCKLVSFGSGVYFCLGVYLVWMEVWVVLGVLLCWICNYEVDDDNVVCVYFSNVCGFVYLLISV